MSGRSTPDNRHEEKPDGRVASFASLQLRPEQTGHVNLPSPSPSHFPASRRVSSFHLHPSVASLPPDLEASPLEHRPSFHSDLRHDASRTAPEIETGSLEHHPSRQSQLHRGSQTPPPEQDNGVSGGANGTPYPVDLEGDDNYIHNQFDNYNHINEPTHHYQPQYPVTEAPHYHPPFLMSMYDRLAPQPTYSVVGNPHSFGHNEEYEQFQREHPMMSQVSLPPPSPGPFRPPYHPRPRFEPFYAFDPEAHRNAYYSHSYQPSIPLLPPAPPISPYERIYYPSPPMDNMYPEDLAFMKQSDFSEQQPLVSPTRSPRVPRRWKTLRSVRLFKGNLVLDCPVAPRLLNQINHASPPERDEFTHMRYSAATCDPKDFALERFTLRQRLFSQQRHTEIFIVVTMYNEDDFLFARTMAGVFKNIEYFCKKAKDAIWRDGKHAWKKIVVCVVSDGRAKIHPRTIAVLAALGVYQDGIAKQQVNGKDVTAHIYEYTTQMTLELGKGGIVNIRPRRDVPVQMIFCLKEKNQKKINSHRWFFQAFGELLQPNVCVLLDAGTKPGGRSIYELWRAFDLQPNCGGACGEIKVMTAHGKNLLNPLVAGQNFEYKMSNILDKPLESAFGFISVLPGAFSAYRWRALLNDPATDRGPLEKYFAGEKMHGANAGIFTANMYLAEDRILCFELVTKRNSRWILQYVKSATGETDVPDRMTEFILQRRRWLNGSFFAAVYAIAHFYQIGRSVHSTMRKIMFFVEFCYQMLNILFAWFAIGNFFLVFRILTTSLSDPALLGTVGRILGVVFEWFYLVTLVACFVLSLGNRPGGSNKFYMTMVYFWISLMAYLTFAAVFVTVRSIQHQVSSGHFTFRDLVENSEFFSIVVSLASTYVMWIVASVLFLDPWHMITCFIQYILLTPTYINILTIYAFCNTHDITWGTKGEDKAEKLGSAKINPDGKLDIELPQDDGDLNAQYDAELVKFSTKLPPETRREPSYEERQEDYYRGFRSAVVLVWIVCNFSLAAVVLNTAGFDRIILKTTVQDVNQTMTQNSTIYMAVVLWSVAGLSLFRFGGALWYLFVRLCRGV